ncbi:MAG: 23S rRNA (adenine(2503)-C(2))-methyltransferase RlmN [Selenomonadaceae bacterium]|nr:23S rRNA (adenine(2503)-C(2))-methyltransferase RlmN [Selenomonadaceae bacterium]
MSKKNLFGITIDELKVELSKLNIPAFRADQIAAWIYKRGAESFDEMTDLSKNLRQQLNDLYTIRMVELIDKLESKDGLTTKFLLQFEDGANVETVLMRHNYGNSICISTQVGCAMGCKFCASTLKGLQRNLTAAEILAEVVFVNNLLQLSNQKVDTIVIMGIGEPLMNFDNLIQFLKLIHEPYTLNLSYRKITVSTCGIVPNIYKLAELNLPITLSISLHAPNNELRSHLMPINNNFNINEVVAAGRDYGDTTGRRVTYEYILIDELNDTIKHARQLSNLLKNQLANVNLIPINPVAEKDFRRPSKERVKMFYDYLNSHGIGATVRKEMGAAINAACGQLRISHNNI